MGNIIEELFYGNIDPQACSIKNNSTVLEQLEILSTNEEILTGTLDKENVVTFIHYVDAWGIVNSESNLDSFITGFRLGARFIYDTFVSDARPYEDLLDCD